MDFCPDGGKHKTSHHTEADVLESVTFPLSHPSGVEKAPSYLPIQ